MCTKWLQEKVTIKSYSLTTSWNWEQVTSWNWDQDEIGTKSGDNAWRGHQWQHVHNCPWLRGDIARCEHQWRHDHFHWLPHCLSVSAHCSFSSCVLARHISRTRTVAHVMSLSTHPHVHVHMSVSPRLALPFYFTHFLPHSFHFLLHLKFVDNLRIPPKESMNLSDEFLLSTGNEPNAYDFKEFSVEPYTELLDSPPLFSDKVSSADADYDDAALEGMLREAHRVYSHHSPREDLSVSLSSSSVSDRTGRPVGDRTGRPVEQRNQEAQIRTLLDKQKEQILAECQARINKYEFQAAYDRRSLLKLGAIVESQQEELHCARAEEVQQRDQQLLQGQLLQQNLELREAHQRSLTEMEELRKFQSSTYDTIARRKLVEDQNTILELSGRIQEMRNEVNCLNDSKDFQDAESVSSGNSHVTSRPVSFPPHPIPEGMLSRSFGVPSRREGPPSIWDTHGTSGNFSCKSRCVIISTLSSRIKSMEFIDRGAASFIYSEKEWKTKTRSRSEMPAWTVSQKFSHLQWRRLCKELWGRPTTTADFGSSFRQIPCAHNICLSEDKIQNWGMYLFTISYGSCAMEQWSGAGWISGWSKIFDICKRNSNARFWSTRRGDGFSTEQNHPEYPLLEKGQSGGNDSSWRRPFPSRKTDCLPDLRIIPGHWSQWFRRALCRLIYSCFSKWWYSGIRFEMRRNFIIDDTYPIWWHLGRIVQIKNTRVWETQDRIGVVQYEDSSEESRTWLSQIEDNGEKKYRARFTKQELWGQKRKLWKKRRGQESGDKTAWTKKSRRLLAMGSQRAVFKRRQLQFPPQYQ